MVSNAKGAAFEKVPDCAQPKENARCGQIGRLRGSGAGSLRSPGRIAGPRLATAWRYQALGCLMRSRRMSRGVRSNSALNTSLKWQVLRNPLRSAISEIATRS